MWCAGLGAAILRGASAPTSTASFEGRRQAFASKDVGRRKGGHVLPLTGGACRAMPLLPPPPVVGFRCIAGTDPAWCGGCAWRPLPSTPATALACALLRACVAGSPGSRSSGGSRHPFGARRWQLPGGCNRATPRICDALGTSMLRQSMAGATLAAAALKSRRSVSSCEGVVVGARSRNGLQSQLLRSSCSLGGGAQACTTLRGPRCCAGMASTSVEPNKDTRPGSCCCCSADKCSRCARMCSFRSRSCSRNMAISRSRSSKRARCLSHK
mmetsp:Transcript_10668/g.29157  ORF Transcript_10668/g.29157 Transcript_10668/m.29157 type:complete len:270 (-) Transcript_10668:157-966(-)